MERLDDYFTFSKKEQHEFGVDEVVPVESAIDTAITFQGVINGLQMRADNLIGDTSREGQIRRANLLQRSHELGIFASAIQNACSPSEVDAFIKDTLDR